jgi:hypothetical protein
MANVKEAINELIEESYLMGLSEQEIRRDFEHFIETCFAVIHDNVKDREAINGLTENLAREKTVILIADHSEAGSEPEMGGEDAGKTSSEVFAEKVARRKRLILKIIAQYDPDLVRLIDEQRFQGKVEDEVVRPKFKIKKQPNWEHVRLLLLKIGYAATIGLIILLILGFIQKS